MQSNRLFLPAIRLSVVAVFVSVAFGSGPPDSECDNEADAETMLVWVSTFATSAPQVDGVVDDVWELASPLTVTVRDAFGGGHPKPVTLRALHTNGELFVIAQWADATESDLRDPYVWSASKSAYRRESRANDKFALQFPLAGEFSVNMLTYSHDFVTDVWHWQAVRDSAGGFVDDMRHLIKQKPVAGMRGYQLGGRATVFIERKPDSGTSSYHLRSAPDSFVGEEVSTLAPRSPAGSLADVRASGRHDGSGWVLEMTRKLDTGNKDDTVIDPAKGILCALAVHDAARYWEHAVSPMIALRFLSRSERFTFEADELGSVPQGWQIGETHPSARPATWQVKQDATSPGSLKVFALTRTENYNGTFNLAIATKTSLRDLDLTVRAKAVSGEEDQGGGPIWRCKDENNYYVCRFNPLEGNFRVYKVVDGRRKQLDSACVESHAGTWYTMRVTMIGRHITCYLNGVKLLAVEDETFTKAGKVGLWTKADAVTSFDDLVVAAIGGSPGGKPKN